MKTKGLLIAVLLTATNFAWAQGAGGLGIDNVEQHMNANNQAKTDSGRSEIVAQSSTNKFEVVTPDRNRTLVDTN